MPRRRQQTLDLGPLRQGRGRPPAETAGPGDERLHPGPSGPRNHQKVTFKNRYGHPLGQTLIVTEGVGWTQIEGGPKLVFHASGILWCPTEHKHWRGAAPHEAMSHIAVQESLNGKPVAWMEHMTDAEYLAPAQID